jgi:hypothetical protein
MTLILDHEGNIIEKVLGGRDWDDKKSVDLIMQEVDKAL